MPGDVEECFEKWGINYKVMGARYNGREVKPLTRYHWEHRIIIARRGIDELLGKYKTRKEAEAAVDERKRSNWSRPKDERVAIGTIVFAQD